MRNRTRTLATVALAAIAALLLMTPPGRTLAHRALAHVGMSPAAPPVRPGDRMRAIALQSLDGASTTVGTDASGVTVYNVFTSWCPSCRAEAPDFAAAAKALAPQGVRFVGIDQQESPSVVARLVADENIPFPVLIDTDAVTKSVLGARMIPTTVVVRNGVVTDVAYGPIERDRLLAMVHAAQ